MGLNSGTSMDGVDAALVEVSEDSPEGVQLSASTSRYRVRP